MEEANGGGVGGGAASSSSSTLLSGGGRLRSEVELKPGETTIVSWKKLIKDANKATNKNTDNKAPPVSAPPVPPPVAANPALDSRIAPPSEDPAENEANDAPPGSRFSVVIEKIERLYMGKNSSDEEDLNDVPDDDEYDTEDSFIDDTELIIKRLIRNPTLSSEDCPDTSDSRMLDADVACSAKSGRDEDYVPSNDIPKRSKKSKRVTQKDIAHEGL